MFDEELSLDELLGSAPLPLSAKKEQKETKVPKAPSAPREVKGVMVKFKNKAGQEIVGPGVLYYVTRCNGKLHYKEASQVTLLPEGWKEGDSIPENA